jgi:hypothetical protein
MKITEKLDSIYNKIREQYQYNLNIATRFGKGLLFDSIDNANIAYKVLKQAGIECEQNGKFISFETIFKRQKAIMVLYNSNKF